MSIRNALPASVLAHVTMLEALQRLLSGQGHTNMLLLSVPAGLDLAPGAVLVQQNRADNRSARLMPTTDLPANLGGNALVQAVHDTIAGHTSLQGIALLFRPHALSLEPGEVLVQRIDEATGLITLVPIDVTALTPRDIIHDTHAADPSDNGPLTFARLVEARSYEWSDGTHK